MVTLAWIIVATCFAAIILGIAGTEPKSRHTPAYWIVSAVQTVAVIWLVCIVLF